MPPAWMTPQRRQSVLRLRRIGRVLRSVFVTVAVTLVIIALLMVALFVDRRSTFNNVVVEPFRESLDPTRQSVAFLGRRPVVDLDAGTVSIWWSPFACGADLTQSADTCGNFTRAVDIYVDTPDNATFTIDPFRIPRTMEDINTFQEMQNVYHFMTVHQIDAGTWNGHLSLDYHFPTDSVYMTTVFEARDAGTGVSIPTQALRVLESATGFDISTYTSYGPGERDVQFVRRDGGTGLGRILSIRIARSDSVMAFAFVIFLCNWGLTPPVLHITVHYLLESMRPAHPNARRNGSIPLLNNQTPVGAAEKAPAEEVDENGEPLKLRAEVPREILLLPVSVILTVPALRDAMPAVPRFGIMLDLVGYFFNIVIIALCSIILILMLIYQRKAPEEPPQPIILPPTGFEFPNPGGPAGNTRKRRTYGASADSTGEHIPDSSHARRRPLVESPEPTPRNTQFGSA